MPLKARIASKCIMIPCSRVLSCSIVGREFSRSVQQDIQTDSDIRSTAAIRQFGRGNHNKMYSLPLSSNARAWALRRSCRVHILSLYSGEVSITQYFACFRKFSNAKHPPSQSERCPMRAALVQTDIHHPTDSALLWD